MTNMVFVLIAGIAAGALAGVVPMLVIARLRARGMRESAIAGVKNEMVVLQERTKAAEADVVRLREENRELQARCGEANHKASGLDSRSTALEQRIVELRNEAIAKDKKLDELTSVITKNHGVISGLEKSLEAERRQSEEKLQLLVAAQDRLKVEFQNIANSIFDEKTKKFSEQSKTNLDLILQPLSQQLGDFRKRVDDVYANESKDRQALSEHIKVLTNLNQQVSQETNNLTRALKGGNKVQGNWGEMILERALELSGLKNGVEYEKQVWGIDEDGKGTRPDVVVHLPEGRDVVVDSKVTLVAYEESVSAETDEAREGALDRHCDAVIGHVNDLHSKSYEAHGKVKTLDYVLMFMPIEAAFVAAITRRPSLFEEAYKKRIILVSPSTLLVSLRTIQNMWQSEYHNRNAQEIAEKAAGLYDKFAGFVETLSKVKKAIESAAGECDAAMGQLSTGGGSLARKIEYFRSLGIKPRKSLPSSMLRASGETDDDDPIDAKSPDYP